MFVIVTFHIRRFPTDKAPFNIILKMKLWTLTIYLENATFTPKPLTRTKPEVIIFFSLFLWDFILSLIWIPTLHNYSYNQRYVAWSARCSTKPFSNYKTSILSAIKARFQRNWNDILYGRCESVGYYCLAIV